MNQILMSAMGFDHTDPMYRVAALILAGFYTALLVFSLIGFWRNLSTGEPPAPKEFLLSWMSGFAVITTLVVFGWGAFIVDDIDSHWIFFVLNVAFFALFIVINAIDVKKHGVKNTLRDLVRVIILLTGINKLVHRLDKKLNKYPPY